MKWLATAIGLSLLAMTSGCREAYTYNNKKFDDAEDALLAQQNNQREILSSITPTRSPIAGTLKVYLPTAERIRESGIQTLSGTPSAEQWSYVITVTERMFDCHASAIRRRKAFGHVVIEKRFDTNDPPDSDVEYVLWLSMPEPGSAAWYLRKRGASRELVPIDTGLTVGLPRMTAWLESIERLARGEAGAHVADKGPPRDDATGKLQRLEKLHEDGVITDEEYRKARGHALDQL